MSTSQDKFIYNTKTKSKELGWSQQELANHVGYESNSSISNRFSGKVDITLPFLDQTAAAFGISDPRDLLNPIPHNKERNISTMNIKDYYTYKNLQLDPRTCVCLTDNQLITKSNKNPEIESDLNEIITDFFNVAYADFGPHQLYITRSLNDDTSLLFPEIYYKGKGSPQNLTFLSLNKDANEEEMVLETIKALKEIMDPLEVTGIFVEQRPGYWAIIHDGVEVGDPSVGAIEPPTCPD